MIETARLRWLVVVAIALLPFTAGAASIQVLAIGASNTAGKGVGSALAWPAQLETMLRAKGYDASVTVNAINGDNSSGILSRLQSAITPGTQVVVYDLGRANDHKLSMKRAQTATNDAEIAGYIRAHGAQPIKVPYDGGGFERQADGKHLTEASHARVAAMLVPKVIAAARAQH